MDTTTNNQANAQTNATPNAQPGLADFATQDAPKLTDADKTLPGGAGKDKRDQLYRRVTARMDDIERELGKLQGNAINSEHANALRDQLSIGKDAMSGGWDHVGEIEAARLSQWLETSQTLIGSGPVDPASAGANLDPASGMPKNSSQPADGTVPVDGSDVSVKATQTS